MSTAKPPSKPPSEAKPSKSPSESPPPPKREKKERKKEEIGQVIDCGSKAYRIESLLGSGGFGDVYKVHLTKDREKKFAMKTERFDVAVDEKMRRLKVEMSVFKAIQAGGTDKSHFARMIDNGKTPEYNFLIMEIVGLSLMDIRKMKLKQTPEGERPTSLRTIAEIARQTLVAVESLHKLGWLNRDIKPHNFAIGLPPRETTIFMLDFGLARPFKDKNGEIRPPRKKVRWAGTLRYTSARALLGAEQSRRDDIETWCYVILEYYRWSNMIWSTRKTIKSNDLAMIMRTKWEVMTASVRMRAEGILNMPIKFCEILTMTSILTFTATPDYKRMHSILDEIILEEKIDMSLPLDWIGMTASEKKLETLRVSEKEMVSQGKNLSPPAEKNLSRPEKQKSLQERRRKLEEEMMEVYKSMGVENVQEKLRRREKELMREIKGGRDGYSSGEESGRSEDDYSYEEDRPRRRRRRRRDREDSDRDRRERRDEDSEGHRRRRDEKRRTKQERKASRAGKGRGSQRKRAKKYDKPVKITLEWVADRLDAIEQWKEDAYADCSVAAPDHGFGYQKLADVVLRMKKAPDEATLDKLGSLLDARPSDDVYDRKRLKELDEIIGGIQNEVARKDKEGNGEAGEVKKSNEQGKPLPAADPTAAKPAAAAANKM